MPSMYDLVREGDGHPTAERDFQAWQEAINVNPKLAQRIAEDALAAHLARKRSQADEVDGLPMPLVSKKFTSAQGEPLTGETE